MKEIQMTRGLVLIDNKKQVRKFPFVYITSA